MKSYAVYYDGTEIGVLYDDEENRKHKYVPNEAAIRLKNSLILKELWFPTDGFSDPIPFFANRIANCLRFGRGEEVGNVIGYHTDPYRLIRLS